MRPLLVVSLFILVACGEPNSSTGQQSASPPPGFVETSIMIDDHYTPEPDSLPLKIPGGVQLDGAQAGYPISMHLTTAETVTITLSDFQSAFPQEKYSFLFDPKLWIMLIDGEEVLLEERFYPYPKDGWVFKPTTTGDATITFVIHQADSSLCEQCIHEGRAVLEVKYYNFLIEPAP